MTCIVNTGVVLIRILLRDALDAYERRTGLRLTYAQLADATGLSKSTIESIGARPSYNATLDVVDKLCEALRCSPAEILLRTETTDQLEGENVR